jgi:hypothetical protein
MDYTANEENTDRVETLKALVVSESQATRK